MIFYIKELGCAVASCDGIFDPVYGKAQFYVCEYAPPGNYAGQYACVTFTHFAFIQGSDNVLLQRQCAIDARPNIGVYIYHYYPTVFWKRDCIDFGFLLHYVPLDFLKNRTSLNLFLLLYHCD
jgi:hypothetical protein